MEKKRKWGKEGAMGVMGVCERGGGKWPKPSPIFYVHFLLFQVRTRLRSPIWIGGKERETFLHVKQWQIMDLTKALYSIHQNFHASEKRRGKVFQQWQHQRTENGKWRKERGLHFTFPFFFFPGNGTCSMYWVVCVCTCFPVCIRVRERGHDSETQLAGEML